MTSPSLSSDQATILARVRELEPEIRRQLRRGFPDVASDAALSIGPLPVDCSHWMFVVATTAAPARRLLVKGPRKYGADPRKREMERHLLTEVSPRIAAANPLARSPRLLASYPDQQLLLLEMVNGPHLYSSIFGLGGESPGSLPALLRLCGEWLARFHRLTRTGETGCPFDWLAERFDQRATRAILDRYAGEGTARALSGLAHAYRERYADFRCPRSLLHRRFGPYHVLVDGSRIYVFDLETDEVGGHAHEDLAHFAAYYDIVFPWRRLAGAWRMNIEEQKRVFLESYCAHAGPLLEPDQIALRFARLVALVTYAADLDKQETWRRRVRAAIGKAWYRHRFRQVCREELGALSRRLGDPGARAG